MIKPPKATSLAISLACFGMGIASYAVQAPGGWDAGYWLAVAVIVIGATGIAMYVHRAVEWLGS
jgi:hypothetical protein